MVKPVGDGGRPQNPPTKKSPPGAATQAGAKTGLEFHLTPQASQVKALMFGRWLDFYASSYPGAHHLLAKPGQHGPCPLCEGKDRARFFPDAAETGGFLCNKCGICADGFETVKLLEGCAFPESLRIVTAWLGVESRPSRVPRKAPSITTKPKDALKPDGKALAAMERVWSESIPADHPDAEPMRRYLDRRGVLVEPVPEVLRFHPSLDYWQPVAGKDPVLIGAFPAMLALVTGIEGEAVGVHRTYLTPEGFKAQPVHEGQALDPRKLMRTPIQGATTGGAVRLFRHGTELAIAEGIETAIAFYLLTGTATWSALNAGGLERVQIPPSARLVWIAADNDTNRRGQDAADALAERLLGEGREVRIVTPKEPGMDWNDVARKVAQNER